MRKKMALLAPKSCDPENIIVSLGTLERVEKTRQRRWGGGGRSNERGPSRGTGWALMEGQGMGRAVWMFVVQVAADTKGYRAPKGGPKKKVTEVKADCFARFVTGEEWKGNEQKEHYRGWIKKSEFVQG